jgi:hypothetical protein
MIPRHNDSPSLFELREGAESATVWLVLGKTATTMTDAAIDTLPTDIDALRALIVAERTAHVAECAAHIAERDKLTARNARLEAILAEIRRVGAI